MPFFVPRALAEIEAKARVVAVERIEHFRPGGECQAFNPPSTTTSVPVM